MQGLTKCLYFLSCLNSFFFLSFYSGALEDLNMAIMLSNGQGKPACQAFTQRGMIYRLEGQDDQALNDFKRAAALGGEFARSQVVLMNPYAAMCNKMLSDVISKLRAGEYVD